jgi:hypothetical protein
MKNTISYCLALVFALAIAKPLQAQKEEGTIPLDTMHVESLPDSIKMEIGKDGEAWPVVKFAFSAIVDGYLYTKTRNGDILGPNCMPLLKSRPLTRMYFEKISVQTGEGERNVEPLVLFIYVSELGGG